MEFKSGRSFFQVGVVITPVLWPPDANIGYEHWLESKMKKTTYHINHRPWDIRGRIRQP